MTKPLETITDKDMLLLQIDMALDLVDSKWFAQLTDFLIEMEDGANEQDGRETIGVSGTVLR